MKDGNQYQINPTITHCVITKTLANYLQKYVLCVSESVLKHSKLSKNCKIVLIDVCAYLIKSLKGIAKWNPIKHLH